MPLFWSTPVLFTTPISSALDLNLCTDARDPSAVSSLSVTVLFSLYHEGVLGKLEEKRADQQGVDVTVCITDRWIHLGAILFLCARTKIWCVWVSSDSLHVYVLMGKTFRVRIIFCIRTSLIDHPCVLSWTFWFMQKKITGQDPTKRSVVNVWHVETKGSCDR